MKARITTAMVEAGVNALAMTRKLSDEAVVAHVFQAMSAAMRLDEIRQRNEPPVPYSHQSWPAVRVGPNGEERVFRSEAEVPAGWLKVGEAPADVPQKRGPGRPPKVAEAAAA